jgi:hypothetical protein
VFVFKRDFFLYVRPEFLEIVVDHEIISFVLVLV